MNNNDMNIAIRFAVAGGQVVVKEVNGITQSTNTATKSLKQLDTAGSESAKGLNKAASGSKQLANNLSDTQSRSAGLRSELGTLIGVTAGIYAAFETLNGVKAIANIAADFNGLQQRLQTATRETRDYNQVSAEIFAISQKNGVALESSVELFQRMATSRKDLKATNSAMLDLNDAVQMLGVLGGASTQALDAGLGQFSQGLSAGIVRAEEWNSILENLPLLAARIGRGMDDIGKSTKELGFGEMRKLVNEGKLLSQDVLQSILVQLPEIREEFAKLPIGLSRAQVMFDNSMSATISKLDTLIGLSDYWTSVLVTASQTLDSMRATGLEDLSPKLQATIKTAETLAYVVGTIGAAAFLKYVASQALMLRSALLVNTASMTTVSALGMVTTTAGTATVATNALAMAQRALLGPIGLVLGVTGVLTAAWFAYEHAADKAKKQNDELAASFERMSNKRKAGLYQETIAELQQVAAQVAEIEAKLKAARISSSEAGASPVPNNGFGVGSVGASVANATFPELDELKKRQAELNAVIEGLNKNFNAGLPALDAYSDKLTDNSGSADKLKEELLKLYNAQMLAATAVDAQGRALNGIDLELFKAQFVDATTLPANAAAAIKQFAADAKTATANLNADTYLTQLKEELKLLDLRLSKGQQTADMQKKLLQFTGANPAALAALQRELQLIEKKQALVTDKETLDSLKKETELLQIRLAKGEKEYEVQKALYQLKGGDPAVIAEIENQIRAQQKLKDQIALTEQISSGAFDKMLDDMTSMNGMATNIGDVLVQAFGSVAQQLEAMNAGQADYNEKVKELAAEKAKLNVLDQHSAAFAKGKASVEEKEAKLKANYFQSQMGHFASLTGAASKMFSEQSKGRQVLHKLEVTFAAIETALALKKAAANALTAISNQGGGDPYSAFARIAAMAAIMAGLGIFSGSAGGGGVSAADRQKTQGTGTVLGDSEAKSESIANALGRIEDLELDQYAELRSINGSIRELSAGIKNLAVNLVASYGKFNESSYPGELGKEYNLQLGSGLASMVGGGVIGLVADKLLGGLVGGLTNKLLGGLFGSKKTELVDSGLSFAAQELGDIISSGLMNATVYDVIKTTKKKLFGLSKSTSESTEYRAIDNALRTEFARIFSHMGKSVTEAVNLLGLETNKTLESFVINLPALSFKDLKGDEIEKELQAMFSQQGDLMVQYLVPGIAEFQKIGEGLYDTLIRVAQEQAVFNSALDNLGLQLSRFAGVTKAIELEVAQSIIELMGGIEQFQSATAEYFAEFYSEQEQLAAITKSATAQFASLGVAMPTSRDGFKALVDSLDLTTDAGQRMFAALMALVPAMDQFYDAAERAKREAEEAAEKARKEAEAKAEAERKLAEDRAAYTSDLQSQLARLDMSSLALALDDIRKWYDAQIKEARELGASTALLEQLYARKRQQIIDNELDKINQDTARQLEQLTGEHERAVSELTSNYDQLFSAMKTAGDAIGSAVLEIKRGMVGWDESGYQSGRIGDLRSQLGAGDIAAQVKTIEQLQAAIVARYQADMATNSAAMDAASARLENLTTAWQEFQTTLGDTRSNITAAILDIRRAMTGWDESGYLSDRVNSLKGQLGAGSAQAQIGIIEQLQSTIVARYQAELATNNELMASAQSKLDTLNSSWQQLSSQLAQVNSAVASSILEIRRSMAGWDEAGYLSGRVSTLRNQLGAGSAQAQIGIIEALQSAIVDRYKANMASNNELMASAQTKLDTLNSSWQQLNTQLSQVGTALESSILDIRRSMAGWNEAAYQANQIASLQANIGTGSVESQISAIEQLQSAVVGRYQAELATNNELMASAQSKLDGLNNSWQQLTAELTQVSQSVSDAILNVQRQMAGWDEYTYQSSRVSSLRSQLGAGSVLEQLNTVQALQQAISDRYSAELAANQQLKTLAEEAYQADLSAHKALADAARQLLSAADALQLSDLSPALMGTQFNEAQSQFKALFKQAQSGDVNAMQALQGAGNSYLELARDYYASGSEEYAQIFAEVEKAYRSFAGVSQSAEPAVPSAVLAYQSAATELQQKTISELTALQTLLDELQAKSLAEQQSAEAAAKAELAAYQNKQLELQTTAIAELVALQQILSNLEQGATAEQQSAEAAAKAELATYQAKQLELQTTAIAELVTLQQILSNLEQRATAEQQSAEAAAKAELATYQAKQLALQTSAIAELVALQQILNDLELSVSAEQQALEAAAKVELAAYQAKQIELQAGAVAELNALQSLLTTLEQQANIERQQALDVLVAKLEEQKAALLDAAERQIAAVKALQPVTSGPVVTNPKPIDPVVIPPWDTPPIIIKPPKDDRIWLPEYPGDPAASAQVVELLQTQLTEQQKANAQQQRQMVILQTELQRTQTMLYETRRLA